MRPAPSPMPAQVATQKRDAGIDLGDPLELRVVHVRILTRVDTAISRAASTSEAIGGGGTHDTAPTVQHRPAAWFRLSAPGAGISVVTDSVHHEMGFPR